MDKMDDSNGMKIKSTSSDNETSSNNDFNIKNNDATEIEQPNPSIATPSFPTEMPVREG